MEVHIQREGHSVHESLRVTDHRYGIDPELKSPLSFAGAPAKNPLVAVLKLQFAVPGYQAAYCKYWVGGREGQYRADETALHRVGLALAGVVEVLDTAMSTPEWIPLGEWDSLGKLGGTPWEGWVEVMRMVVPEAKGDWQAYQEERSLGTQRWYREIVADVALSETQDALSQDLKWIERVSFLWREMPEPLVGHYWTNDRRINPKTCESSGEEFLKESLLFPLVAGESQRVLRPLVEEGATSP